MRAKARENFASKMFQLHIHAHTHTSRSRLEIMRHIYNCEQNSIPRAMSSNDLHNDSSQQIESTFDETNIPLKGQFDFSIKARFVDVVHSFLFLLFKK